MPFHFTITILFIFIVLSGGIIDESGLLITMNTITHDVYNENLTLFLQVTIAPAGARSFCDMSVNWIVVIVDQLFRLNTTPLNQL